MNDIKVPLYYKYWGKARKRDASPPGPLSTPEEGEIDNGSGYDYHLLPYHCLDVAAVGRVWLEEDKVVKEHFVYSLGSAIDPEQVLNTLCLFLTLHDFGKFDIRFQSKVPEVRDLIWDDLNNDDLFLSQEDILKYDHGRCGYGIFQNHCFELTGGGVDDYELADLWKPWIAASTGHHGVIPKSTEWIRPLVEDEVIDHDNKARQEWLSSLLEMFSCDADTIPMLYDDVQKFFAGFCSIVDWIASNELFVRWNNTLSNLSEYFNDAMKHCRETEILKRFGIVGLKPAAYKNISLLLPAQSAPRQIQTVIDDINPEPGLTIIEGTTGSGKTEAALSVAWRLIANGHADSIIFALPTQATANAMLERLYKLAPILFSGGGPNVVLAHGKAVYNDIYSSLKRRGKKNIDEGLAQCSEWISSSRKLVFLGQVGVCTIDQVLLSVVPVRHNFIRSYGLGRSVLIVDEVHAYDRYMYGLLEEVLRRQKAVNGSAVLLSATLPGKQKQELFKIWVNGTENTISADMAYPLLSKISNSGEIHFKTVDKDNRPVERTVTVEITNTPEMKPEQSVIVHIIDAGKNGATVGLVCNTVDAAQSAAHVMQEMCDLTVDIFHSRYRFVDRQKKEATVLNNYGKKSVRTKGRILVATQVIEQSLDLDFDWLLSQLCPVDLLFQRMGRLHRHNRMRPQGSENPLCTILSTDSSDFGIHQIIYGDARILWRTRELLLECNREIRFPDVYREWIERVYSADEWSGTEEPENIIGASFAFQEMQKQAWYEAKQMAVDGINPFDDTDSIAVSLTRGKEMGLNIIPLIAGEDEQVLLDGERKTSVNEYEWKELLNLNAIPVPVSWRVWLPRSEEGYIYLRMRKDGEEWILENGNKPLKYSTEFGLEKLEEKV